MSKIVTIKIQDRTYQIHTGEEERYLHKIAAQLDLLLTEAVHSSPNTSLIEQLILVGLEQQDQINCMKKQISDLEDKLEHYDLGEGLGCLADYRQSLSAVNQKADALQHENDSLRAQLGRTFEALTRLTEAGSGTPSVQTAGKDHK